MDERARSDFLKIYEFGEKEKPEILLLPGTCCPWTFFGNMIPGLLDYFHVLCVSYDGFDPSENTVFKSMLDETAKIEDYLKEHYNGKIYAAYGSLLGGSFVGLLISRQKIHITHGIIGRSDLDQNNKIIAKISTKMLSPVLYKALTSDISQNKLFNFIMDKKRKDGDDYIDKFMELMSDDAIKDYSFIKKESMENQFYSDLITPLPEQIEVPGSEIHVFYALKMGKKYRKRYLKYFKNPDIIEHNLRHEELLLDSKRWVTEVAKVCKVI